MSTTYERFVARIWVDIGRNELRAVEEYLQEFPGAEQQIRAEYAAVVEELALPPHGDRVHPSATAVLLGKLASSPLLDEKRFRTEAEVGRGGMGVVLRVFDEHLGRHLALKVMQKPPPSLDPEQERQADTLLARFLEEAQVTSQLDHPGVIPVHELGLDARGQVWFTMRLVRGMNASQTFRLARDERDGWTRTRALEVILKVCDAMAYAHEKGVLHRDLKPGNVMVGRFGEVYVMDWGLAKVVGGAEVRTTRCNDAEAGLHPAVATIRGKAFGTPSYMPPEQARGEDLDERADVYAIGAMLYELCTGSPPYVQSPRAYSPRSIVEDVRAGPPRPVHALDQTVPAELVAVVEKAMARDRDRRYASVGALAGDLRAYLGNRVVAAYRTGALAEMRMWVRRNQGLAAALATAVLILVAGIVGTSVLTRAESVARAEAQTHLEHFEQLRDVVTLREAKLAAQELYPAWPDKLPAIESWLREYGDHLAGRLPELRAARDAMRARATAAAATESLGAGSASQPESRTLVFPSRSDAFLHETLSTLLTELEAFTSETGELGDVRGRRDEARNVRKLSIEDHQKDWDAAVAAIAKSDDVVASKRYEHLVLKPQLGLVPLGIDKESRLWEFAHLGSGKPATRDKETGKLVTDDETGIVLVLLPGTAPRNCFWMGAQQEGQNADAQARADEGPVREVELQAFFLGKHELTQAQWLRLSRGENPSVYAAGKAIPGRPPFTLRHPVENVDYELCNTLLMRQGLLLPTEAQWEYGCRAGTSTPWWSGQERESLRSPRLVANLADQAAAAAGASYPEISDWPGLDDGNPVHAPVGTFAANAFGLHDVHGNVQEWCRDWYLPYSNPVQPGDGLRLGAPSGARIRRGGSYGGAARHLRSAVRHATAPGIRDRDFGVRPARSLAT